MRSVELYDPSELVLPAREDLNAIDMMVHDDPVTRADLLASCELEATDATDLEVAALVAPERMRFPYQKVHITPWDWCPQRSACTSESASSSASRPGRPGAT